MSDPPATRAPRGPRPPPTPPAPAENLFLASDDPLPLAGVQLVRPRHYAAPGAPAGPRTTRQPEIRQLSGRGAKQSAQPGNRHASHRARTPTPLDSTVPMGAVLCRRSV